MTTETTTTPADGLRRCIGSSTFGIEAHEAPVGDFPVQPSQKDGLGRMCKPHWKAYTGALRKAALARKAEQDDTGPEDEPEPAPDTSAPAYEHTLAASLVGEGEPIEPPARRRTKATVARELRDIVA